MPDERPPARPWYDLVMEQAAIRGWGVAELARKAGVSRPTIYGWRDNPSKPQAKPVNAVADTLGIDRARAVRLAGIVDGAPESGIEPQDDHERLILSMGQLTDDDKRQMIASYRKARKEAAPARTPGQAEGASRGRRPEPPESAAS